MGSVSLPSPGTQQRDRLLMPGISCMWPMYGREGEWGISYFWYWLNWIARLDVFVLALMLTYVIAVFSRAFYRYHFPPGAQGSDSPSREYREFIGELSIKAGSIKAIASASPYVGLVGTCFGISSVFRGFAMAKHMVQIIETSIAAVSLVPTAAGILVAVPAIGFHNYLRMRIELLRSAVCTGALVTQKFPLTKQFSVGPAFALIAAPVLAILVAAYTTFSSFSPSRGFAIELASAYYQHSGDHRLVSLHVSDAGKLFLDSEQQDWSGLAGGLSQIYGMEAHRSLCLVADEGVPFQTVANVLDTVGNTPTKITVWLATPQSPRCSLP